MMTCNVISPQLFWFKKLRRNIAFTFVMSIVVNIGMWFERFVIIVTSVYRDYLPSSWSIYYRPSIWEIGFYLGTFGLFFTCFFLFAKYFPVIAIAEIKHVLKTSGESYKKEMGGMEKLSATEFHDNAHHDDGHHDTHVKVAHH
jgi:molybdopterin-containing oxidoreductase family membrane subunit